MKLRVDVMSDALETERGAKYQVLAVWYPTALMPVEDKNFLGKSEPMPKGRYELDLQAGGLVSDARRYNAPRFDYRKLRPVAAQKAA